MTTRFDKLLVLDLDETLVHTVSFDEIHQIGHPQCFPIKDDCWVYPRPGVQEFLASCFGKFREVGLWTAGTRNYALEVLPRLCDPKDFAFIWGRERCTWHRCFDSDLSSPYDDNFIGGAWLKDIRKLRRKGYEKEKILFVDDNPANFKRSYSNLIQIQGFYGDLQDRELHALDLYLDEIGCTPNVRSIEKRFWRTMNPR